MKLRKIPRGTFWLGALAGVALGVPLITLLLHAVTEGLGWGPLRTSLEEILWISLAFAGIPALISGGGVARFVAHRMAERGNLDSRRALVTGAATMAVAGVGLTLLAAVPLGAMPDEPRTWAPLGAIGLLAGGVTGVALGALVALRQRRHQARGAVPSPPMVAETVSQ
jgi:O-antigen/teichoic acid export membrane protein